MTVPAPTSEMEGLENSSSVRQLIIRVSDQLSAGEIRLIEVDPKEVAAKARLDEVRKKRRERHAKKKQSH